jgi:hypothetical protein
MAVVGRDRARSTPSPSARRFLGWRMAAVSVLLLLLTFAAAVCKPGAPSGTYRYADCGTFFVTLADSEIVLSTPEDCGERTATIPVSWGRDGAAYVGTLHLAQASIPDLRKEGDVRLRLEPTEGGGLRLRFPDRAGAEDIALLASSNGERDAALEAAERRCAAEARAERAEPVAEAPPPPPPPPRGRPAPRPEPVGRGGDRVARAVAICGARYLSEDECNDALREYLGRPLGSLTCGAIVQEAFDGQVSFAGLAAGAAVELAAASDNGFVSFLGAVGKVGLFADCVDTESRR